MKWSSKITKMNCHKQFLHKKICIVFLKSHLTRSRTNRHKKFLHEKICIVFLKSHFTSKQNAKHVINIFSQQIVLLIFITINKHFSKKFTKSCVSKKKLLRTRKFIIVIFSKKNNSQIKRLFSFIIAYFLKNTSTIQSFREMKRLKRFNLWDFHYTYQNFIAAR
jgi:GMP synthase PP-ATPase subunit